MHQVDLEPLRGLPLAVNQVKPAIPNALKESFQLYRAPVGAFPDQILDHVDPKPF